MPEPTQRPLSRALKKRIADFHSSTTEKYWWHDPRYLDLCAEIKKELTDA